MTASGKRGLLVERELSFMLMVTFMREVGSITNAKGMVFILIRRVRAMKGTGKTIPNMDKVQKNGLKDQNMWACTSMEEKKVLEHICGPTDQSMLVIGRITK